MLALESLLTVVASLCVALWLTIWPLPLGWHAWQPQWLLLLLMVWGLWRPHWVGTWTALGVGCVLDLLMHNPLGLHAIGLMLSVYAVQWVGLRRKKLSDLQFVLCLLVIVAAERLLYAVLLYNLDSVSSSWSVLWSAITTSILAAIVLPRCQPRSPL